MRSPLSPDSNYTLMHRQINITLPDETIELIDQVVDKGDSPEETLRDRSRFINKAVEFS